MVMRRHYPYKLRRVRTLALEEGDPLAPQVNRVQEERSGSLDVGELNENIAKLTKLLANINMAPDGPCEVFFNVGKLGTLPAIVDQMCRCPTPCRGMGICQSRPGKNPLRATCEQHVAVKLDKESGCVIDDVVEMREVMVRTGSDRWTLVIYMTINNHYVEAVVDSGAQVSVLIRRFYDSLSCRPRPIESIRMKGASASDVMVGCRVDGVEVDLGNIHGNHSMTMYVANITDNCILGLDYLKARKAVIDLSQGVLVFNDTIVKGKYKYAEGTPVRTHKVRLVNDCHLFLNSVSRATLRIQTDDIHPVVVQARKNGPYLVPNTLLMPGDASLYIINDSDSHIQLKDGMVVAVGQEALRIEGVSESDGMLTKWNGQSVLNQKAFDALRQKLMEAPVITYPNSEDLLYWIQMPRIML